MNLTLYVVPQQVASSCAEFVLFFNVATSGKTEKDSGFSLDTVTQYGYMSTQNRYESLNMITALFQGTKRKVLALFFLNSDKQYYFSEVARHTKTRQGVVQRELKNLTEAGILNAEKRGRQKFYSANKSNPIFPDLRNIVFKTFGVISQVRDALKPLEKGITIALVHGSFARGEEVADSDIDLLVIGTASLDKIVSTLAKVENDLCREINPSLYSEAEFKKKFSEKNNFIRSVMKSDKEFIVGTEDEFRRLAK